MPWTMPLEEISTAGSCRTKLEEYTRICRAVDSNGYTKYCI